MNNASASVFFSRKFRLFFSSHVANESGGAISLVALPLLAAVTLSASAFEMALLVAVERSAVLLLGLPAGVWVDRLQLRSVLIFSDLIRGFLVGLIFFIWTIGLLNIYVLLFIGFLLGCAKVFGDVADQSYLPELVGPGNLIDGNAKLEAVRTFTVMVGPGVAGMVVQVVGAAFSLLGTMFASVVSCIFLLRIPSVRREESFVGNPGEEVKPEEASNFWLESTAGIKFVFKHGALKYLAFQLGVTGFATAGLGALYVFFLATVLQLQPFMVGLLFALAGVSSLAGAFASRFLVRRFGGVRIIWLAPLATFPFALLFPLAQGGLGISFYAVAAILFNAGLTVFNIAQLSYRQTVCPPGMLGRMNATFRLIVWGAGPVGALLAGALGEVVGVRYAMLFFGLVISGSVFIVMASPIVKVRDLSDLGIDFSR